MTGLRFWRRRTLDDDELDRELEVHLALEVEEQQEAGLAPRDARLAAHRAFGSVALTKEELRDMRSGAALDRIGRELWHAARRLIRTPAFTLATVLTLALAIAANVAIFAVVHRVILNPLPYGDSSRLVALDFSMPDRNVLSGIPMTLTLYYEYLDRARTLDGIAAYRADERTLAGRRGIPERVRVARSTTSLTTILQVPPAQGRWFIDAEGAPGAAPVAVISHGLWVRRYGRNPETLGQQVTLDEVPTTVIGVMPASFTFPDPRVDVWIPDPVSRAIAASPAAAGVYDYSGVARLRAGATIADARAELTRLAVALAPANRGAGYDRLRSVATTLIDATVGRVAATLWIVLASVALVLLVACANVANLFLVRSDAKQREIAVRRALGAGAGGIAGYFLAESAWLVASGGAIGVALGWGGVRLLVALAPSNLPRLEEVRLDAVALAFSGALSVFAGVICGSIPLVRLGPLATSLHESGCSSTASRARHQVRQFLMAGQVALALVLLVSSGLMVRSFQKLRAIDPGFAPASALTFRVGLPPAAYADREKIVAAHRAMLDRLSSMPAVTVVSAATCLPLSEQGCFSAPLFVEGRPLPPGTPPIQTRVSAVADRYFDAMGTRVLAGRAIDRSDLDRNEAVVVVNQALANMAFPQQDPIGQRVSLGNPAATASPGWLTIVGVVATTSYRALAEPSPVPMLYVPTLAARVARISPPLGAMSYVVRTDGAPQTITEPARRTIMGFDANLAIAQVRTLEELVDRASAQMAFTMVLLGLAACVALLLGMVGVYGVMSYIVSQRTGEIGVRLALGARPGGVVALIVRQGGTVALAGTIIGLGIAFTESRLIASLLYGVNPRDPAVYGATSVTLLAIALVACWLPARRAVLFNPLDALRAQ